MHKILLAIAALACLANTGDQIEALTDSGEYAAAFSIATAWPWLIIRTSSASNWFPSRPAM